MAILKNIMRLCFFFCFLIISINAAAQDPLQQSVSIDFEEERLSYILDKLSAKYDHVIFG